MTRISGYFVAPLVAAGIFFSAGVGAQTVDVEFIATEPLLEQLRGVSLLRTALAGQRQSDAEVLAAAQADYQRYLSALYENGYYGAQVSIRINGKEAASYSPFDNLGGVRSATVTIAEGPEFEFGRTAVAPLPQGAELPPEFERGQVARSPVVQEAVDAGIDAWRDDGRPKARVVSQSVVANHRTNELDAEFVIDPDRTATFGDLNIVGSKRMKDYRIRKIAGLQPGARFSPAAITRAAERLRRTGVFSTVALREADAINPDGTLDINATLVEAKLRRFGAGATLSTHDGLSMEGFWLHRNVLGGGEQLRFDAEVTGIGGETDGRDYRFGVSLARPATLTPDTRAVFNLDYEREEEPEYSLTTYTVGLTLDHRIDDKWRATAGIEYRDTDADDAFGVRNFRLFGLPASLTYDNRDDKISASNGTFASVTGQPFYDLDRSVSGLRLGFDGRAYRGFGADERFVLAGRVQLGAVYGPSLENIAPDYLYYSGGGGTVRGQEYESLGVDLDNGEKTGGKSFAGASLEFRFPIRPTWGGVVFADTGYIGSSSSILTNGDSHAGVGLGARIETGLGPIRVDVAVPADGEEQFKNLNFYIGIGQAF